MMDQVIDYTKFMVEKYKVGKIKLVLLGGEPLLDFPSVKYLATRIKELSCNTKTWMFTNGLLISPETMRLLSDLDIFVILSANNSSEEFILEQCETIVKYQNLARVNITIDSSNLERLIELNRQILKNGFYPRLFVENKSFVEKGFIERYIPILSKCLDDVDNYVSDPNRLIYLYESFDPRWTNEKSPYNVGRSLLSFEPDGTVRTSSALKEGYLLGKLGDGIDYIQAMNDYPNRRVELPRWSAYGIPECERCKTSVVCQGGYPIPKYFAYGRFDKHSPYCKAFKALIPKFVDMYRRKLL